MLPRAVATTDGQQLVAVDIVPDGKTSAAAVGGQASVLWDPVPPGYFWLIQRMSTSTTSTTSTQLAVYAGNRLIDGSNSGNFDFSSDNGAGAMVDSMEQLSATWYGLSAGATGTLHIQYALMYRGT